MTATLPVTSVVIPTRGRSDLLPTILAPLLADRATSEVVVVADGDERAHDVARGLARRDERVVVVPTPGLGKDLARQTGVERATGEVLVLLDDDVLAEPGLVGGHAAAHADARGLVVVGYMPVADPEAGIAEELYAAEYEAGVRRYERDDEAVLCGFWGGNISMRREDARRVSWHDPGFDAGYNADRDFGLRLRQAGLSGAYRRELRARHLYRRSLSQLRRDAHSSGEGRWLLHRRHADVLGPLPEDAFSAGLPPARAGIVRAARRPRLRQALRPLLGAIARAPAPRPVRRAAAVLDLRMGQQAAAQARERRAGPSAPQGRLPVAVVIPAYNRPEMVRRALASVAAQTAAPSEVIVVDDCSTDATGEVAAQLGARVVRHESNQGEGASRNTGIAHAGQPWVALLDSDDEWLPHHLATVWALRDGHVLVGGSCIGVGRATAPRVYGVPGSRALTLSSPAQLAHPDNCVPPSAALLRRDAALAAGGFDPGLERCADMDLWLRMLERGSGVASPRVTARYHLHVGQVSGDRMAMQTAHRAVLERYADRPWCAPAVRRRYEGLMVWDAARAELADGRRAAGLMALARGLARDPRRALGIPAMLAWRLRLRRRSARLADSPEAAP
jgi:glycosyltransferase involved in cell wall biosynthesis